MDFLSTTVKKKKKFGIMAGKFNYPTRMCIICKNRFQQANLYRYQVKDGDVIPFSKIGRSFYICKTCLHENDKRLAGILKHKYKINSQMESCVKRLKEIATNGR